MKLAKQLEEELRRLYLLYFESLFRADARKYESFFVDDFKQFGTTLEEAWFSKSESGKYLETHVEPVAGKIELRNRDILLDAVDSLVVIIEQADCFVNIDGVWVYYDRIRISSLMQNTSEGWKFVQQHMSFPDSRTEEGQTVALDKIKAENIQLRDAVKRRTVELENLNLELKHALSKLKSTQTQLIQSEKMASLGTLTAGIAHEIQNPLNFVNNFSEISNELIKEIQDVRSKTLNQNPPTEEDDILKDIGRNLEKIAHYGKRAETIVKAMLEHSRKSSGTKSPTNLNHLAEECLGLSYNGMLAKDKLFHAEYKTDFDPKLPKVEVVSEEIGRVLINLINNAFYAVFEKSKTSPPDYRPEVVVNTTADDKGVMISVQDNGHGIPKAIREKIFEPFFTTKPTGSGTGLGLSLSYDIVKAHGGELEVESEKGEGSTFYLRLPPS